MKTNVTFYKFIKILFASLGLIPDAATNQFKSGFIFFNCLQFVAGFNIFGRLRALVLDSIILPLCIFKYNSMYLIKRF